MRTSALALGALLLVGCGPDKRIVGSWDWGQEKIKFTSDGVFESCDVEPPQTFRMGGSWSTHGDELTLQPTVIDPPEAPPIHFQLSPDGKTLTGVDPKDGTMTNRRA